jgi:sodium transport system permease protein
MSRLWVVFIKECRESIRDRRALFNAVILGPILIPLVFAWMVQRSMPTDPLPSGNVVLSVAGAGTDSRFLQVLRDQGATVRMLAGDPLAAVRSGAVLTVLCMPANVDALWEQEKTLDLTLVFDGSLPDSAQQARRVTIWLDHLSTHLAGQRLGLHALPAGVAFPLRTLLQDQSTAHGHASAVWGMLPYFLLMSFLMGSLWVALDTTAGERERQSIEALLLNPVPPAQLLMGKWLAVLVAGSVSLILGSWVACGLAYVMAGTGGGVLRDLTVGRLVGIYGLMIMPCALLSLSQVWLAALARSLREAQTYLGLFQLLPLLVAFSATSAMTGVGNSLVWVPLVGQLQQIPNLLQARAMLSQDFLICSLLTGTLTVLVFQQCLRLFRSGKVALTTRD